MKFCRDYIIGVEDIGKDNKITNWAFLKHLEEIACSHSALCDFGVNDIPTKQKANEWIPVRFVYRRRQVTPAT